ncbi:hypothetical protein L596_025430 [Steinernema carpocapsae]|uniref:Chaperone DnaJ C-terminal domain-containing protein n=1 Tax=Steinernema carpocapsae TaxID=34508 RepID=A0A4U5M8L2_STECR|nr:hypothetical protein L596_025430 [Steinernema carpocapsae]
MRLTGKGIKRLNHNGRGDQYISIKVRMPKHLNERQKALIQAWAELELDTPGTVTGIRKTEDGKEGSSAKTEKGSQKPEKAEKGAGKEKVAKPERVDENDRKESDDDSILGRVKKAIFG